MCLPVLWLQLLSFFSQLCLICFITSHPRGAVITRGPSRKLFSFWLLFQPLNVMPHDCWPNSNPVLKKKSLQGYYIIKINPDCIKLCWNRPQMFTLLQQLLEGARSSRRYSWVSGRWVWVYFCSTIQMCEGKHPALPPACGGSCKLGDCPAVRNHLHSQRERTQDLLYNFLLGEK